MKLNVVVPGRQAKHEVVCRDDGYGQQRLGKGLCGCIQLPFQVRFRKLEQQAIARPGRAAPLNLSRVSARKIRPSCLCHHRYG